MSLQFARAAPLQAGKLVVIVVTLLFSAGVSFGLFPGRNITSLLIVPVLALGIALVVAAESAIAAYRTVRAGERITDRLASRPVYSLVRTLAEVYYYRRSAGT